MATTKISTGVLKDGSVTSAKLDTNISIVGDLTVDTNTLFVDSASNRVGIGTSSPLLKLDIKGTNSLPATSGTVQNGGIRIENGVNNGVLDIGASNATGAPGWIQATDKTDLSQSYNLLLNPNGGDVGIGTTSPSAKLEIFGSGNTLRLESDANQSKEILFRNVGTGTAVIKTDGDLRLDAEDTGKTIQFNTAGAERMRITSTGDVGIGTSSPSAKFSVLNAPANSEYASMGSGGTVDRHLKFSGFVANGTNNVGHRLSARNAIALNVSDNDALYIDREGTIQTNVTKPFGSNTANLRLKLTPTGTNYSSGAFLNIVFGDETLANSYLGDIQVVQGDPSASTASSMRFLTNSGGGNSFTLERMRLQSNGDLHVDGDVIAYSTTISDERLKDDVQTIDNALDKVSNLRGVSYTWNNGNRKGQKDLGLIAQEVEQVLPELVREKEMPMIDGGTYKTIDYEKIVGVLIEAVKELKAEVELLKSK